MLAAAAEEEEPPKKKKKKKSSSKKKQVKKVIKPASTSKAATAATEDKPKDLSEAILGLSKNSNTMKVRRRLFLNAIRTSLLKYITNNEDKNELIKN